MELEKIRKKIDGIDEKIIKLIDERLSLMPEVAKAKKENKLNTLQPGREKEKLAILNKLAKERNISQSLIEKIFIMIMEESKAIQEKSR